MNLLPQGKYVDIFGGNRIHYHEVGSGFPLIFIHGSGPGASGYSNFWSNAQAIAQAGIRCLLPDMLGYGYSTMTQEPIFTYDDLVRGIADFAEKLGLKEYALAGNSMGGAVAITLALQQPKRVKKLVLMAPGGLEPREVYMEMKGIRTMIKAMYAPEGITRESLKKIFQLQLYNPALITDDLVEQRFQVAQKQAMRMFEKVIVPNQAEKLGDLQQPILGFWGVNDQFCPPSGAMIVAKACKNTKMTLLSECGHWVMVEHAAYFNRETIAFLQGL